MGKLLKYSSIVGVALVFGSAVWSAEVDKDKGGVVKDVRPVHVGPSEAELNYVRDNVVATFYHEYAHGLIEILDLPVLGLEENAADVLSILLVNRLHPAEEAWRMAKNSLDSYRFDADDMREQGVTPVLWDDHGLARQRYYNGACLFYGADTETRDDFVETMGLPEGRAEYCGEEFELADGSWGQILDGLKPGGDGGIKFLDRSKDNDGEIAGPALRGAIKQLNETFGLPATLVVSLKRCGRKTRGHEAYFVKSGDDEYTITVCTEYAKGLLRRISAEE